MPRRKVKGSTRAKPVLPEGDEGDALSKEEKKEKLQAFLQDFDDKVEEKKVKLEKLVQSILSHIEASYLNEIKALPMPIRQMKLSDFIALGGTVDAVLNNPDLGETDDDFDLAQIKVLSTSKKACAARSRLNSTKMYDTISEEGSGDTSVMKSAKKPRKKLSTKKGKNSSILANISNTMPPPPSVPRTAFRNPNGYFTPVNRGLAAAGWETPLITPKFDPRLPVTPAQMRDARPGEMFMSLGGSPIRDTITTMQRVLKEKEQELLQQFGKTEQMKVQEVISTLSDIIGKSKDLGGISE